MFARAITIAVLVSIAGFGSAKSQDPSEMNAALLEQGEALYESNCTACHQSTGAGVPPTFPALNGNENLTDLTLIVTNINQGKQTMPPFPHLSAEDVAALATYVRNAWDNDFGGASVDQVSAILEGVGGGAEQVSIWDGVYTEDQAERGREAYGGTCDRCHGRFLNGAPEDPDMRSTPPLARAKFIREWDGQPLASVFEYTKATMPQNNPGFLSDQQYVDIIALMLSESSAPAGDTELPATSAELAGIVIEQEPK